MFRELEPKGLVLPSQYTLRFFPDWSLEDIEDVLRELGRNNFLNNLYADDTVYDCELSNSAIVKMESQKKETLLSVADFISKFIPW